MDNGSSLVTPRITRKSLLDAGSVLVSGCAIRLRITVVSAGNVKVPAGLEYLRAHKQEIDSKVRDALNEAFGKIGRKSKNYTLGPISVIGDRMWITIYGHDKVIRSRGSYGGERWVGKVDRFQFLVQKHVQAILQPAPGQEDSLIHVRWKPGNGLLCSDYLVDPASLDPALSADLRRLRDVANRYDRNRTIFLRCCPLALLVISTSFWLVYRFSDSHNSGLHLFITAILWTYLIVPLTILCVSSWANSGSTRQEIYRKEANLDLRGALHGDEQNAFKLFQVNSSELKRYYDQALKQRALVFSLGIFCILGGFIVIGVTMYVLVYSLGSASLAEKLVVGGLGVVGGILANFIAVIFLHMFRAIVTSMVDFHNRLVLTNHIYFGNLLLARVGDSQLREETLSKLALALSHLHGPLAANSNGVADSGQAGRSSIGKRARSDREQSD